MFQRKFSTVWIFGLSILGLGLLENAAYADCDLSKLIPSVDAKVDGEIVSFRGGESCPECGVSEKDAAKFAHNEAIFFNDGKKSLKTMLRNTGKSGCSQDVIDAFVDLHAHESNFTRYKLSEKNEKIKRLEARVEELEAKLRNCGGTTGHSFPKEIREAK